MKRIFQVFRILLIAAIIAPSCSHLVLGQATTGGAGAVNTIVSPKIQILDSATAPPLNITERSSAPSNPASGDVYLDDGTSCSGSKPCWKRYTGAVWEEVGDGSGSGGSLRWTAETTFSRTDDDTILITVDDCTNYQIGTPIRYSADASTWYYAIVTACTDNGSTISADIDGAPFTTTRDDYLSYGTLEVLRTVQLVGVGNASVSDTWFPKYLWGGPDAYFIRVYIYVDTAPTGAALTGNVELNGTNALDTEFSIAASGTSTDSNTTLDDSTYSNTVIEQDEFVEIDISQIGSTVPGGNVAWAKLYFIIP